MHCLSKFHVVRVVLATALLAACSPDEPMGVANASRLRTEPSFAAQGGKTPKIAFSAGQPGQMAIYTMRPDGTGRTAVTSGYDDLTPTWSPDRRRLAFVRMDGFGGTIHIMSDKGGRVTPLLDGNNPQWSPDGTRIVFDRVYAGNKDVWVMGADGSNPQRLTTHIAVDEEPTWSPDGTKIAFRSARTGVSEVFVMNADGSSETRVTYCDALASQCTGPAWSPIAGDDRIAFASNGSVRGVFTVKADGSAKVAVVSFDAVSGFITEPSWSPDATQLAFTRHVPGTLPDIYRVNVDGTSLVPLTSNIVYDQDPAWAR
jgi:Tol biopolymer transport system component